MDIDNLIDKYDAEYNCKIIEDSEIRFNNENNKPKLIRITKCIHNVSKYHCSICKPELICEHYIIRSKCIKCRPEISCIHNQIKWNCKKCKSNSILEVKKDK